MMKIPAALCATFCLLVPVLSYPSELTVRCYGTSCPENYICSGNPESAAECYRLEEQVSQADTIESASSLQSAYNSALTGDTIKLLAGNNSGDFTTHKDIAVSVIGGFSADYSAPVSTTSILGKVVINKGTVKVAGLNVTHPPPLQYLVFGSSGTGNGRFNYPRGIVLDGDSNIYVADSGNHRIQKFTSSGVYITQWGSYGSAAGQFAQPSGLVLNSSKTLLYVVDSQNHRIQVFDLQGTYVSQFGSNGTANGKLNYPRGIASDSDNFLYVTDVNNSRIQKFNSSGSFVTAWGSSGSGDGQFIEPYGVATDRENNVYVMEFSGHRAQKFTSSGAFVAKWGSFGTADGQFRWPDGIAVNSDGVIFVCDEGSNRLEKFSPELGFISKIGSYGGPVSFSAPHNIYLDSFSNAYVTDELNNRIQVIPAGYNGF